MRLPNRWVRRFLIWPLPVIVVVLYLATVPLLIRARRTVFLVSGAHKADIVAEVLGGESDHPAAVVSNGSRDAVWLLDRDAARRLPG